MNDDQMSGQASRPPPSLVMIWHSMDTPAHAYMYEQVVATLMDGFHSVSKPPVVVYGQGVRRRHSAAYQGNLSKLRAGDALIWVGWGFADAATPWAELGQRGVRRVFYQCEPEHRCASRRVGRYAVDEMWDFAWHNFEACSTSPTAPLLRYVPLGAASMYALPTERVPLPMVRPGALLFFGNVRDGPPRHKCFKELQGLLVGEKLANTFRAWDDESYQRLLREHAIWLNLHKGCGDAHNPITFRVSKALLAGRLILSERSHPKDEAEFAGLGISFYDNMSAIATAYEALVRSYSSFGPKGTGALADATRRIRAFRRRFAPRLLFERALVYRDWGMVAST